MREDKITDAGGRVVPILVLESRVRKHSIIDDLQRGDRDRPQ